MRRNRRCFSAPPFDVAACANGSVAARRALRFLKHRSLFSRIPITLSCGAGYAFTRFKEMQPETAAEEFSEL
jgi:hypothetical protein